MLTAVVLFAFSSCKSLTYSERTTKTVNPQASAHVMPMVSELEVAKDKSTTKVTFNEKMSQTDVSMGPNSAKIKKLKAKALGEAVEKLGCDVIVAPVYQVEALDNQTIEVTVTGFPASYKGFRTANTNDIDLLLKNDSILLISGGTLGSDWQDTRIVTHTQFSRGPGFDIRLGAGLFSGVDLNAGFAYYMSNKLSVGAQFSLLNLEFDTWAVLGDVRYYFSDKPFSLFADIKAGWMNDRYESGVAIAPSIGISYRYFDFSVGATLVGFEDFGVSAGLSYNIPLKKN